jgi:hypothetical protein
MNSLQVLHIQHHSITIVFILRKLSKVKIYLRVAVHKECHSRKNRDFPNTLPRKSGLYKSRQYLIVRLHFKGLPVLWDPTNCILAFIPHFLRVQLKKSGDHFLLSIMHKLSKQNIPLKVTILDLHILLHPCILTTCNSEQLWKEDLQR